MPSSLSPDCRELLSKMMRKSAHRRISMTDILNHDWILKNTQDFQRWQYFAPSQDQLKDNTLNFKKYSHFKQMSIR